MHLQMSHSAKVRITLEIFNGPKLEVEQTGPADIILRDRATASPDTLAWLIIDIDEHRVHRIVTLPNGIRGEDHEVVSYIELESKGIDEDGIPILQTVEQ
jgi:hypothetical protein